MLKTASKWISAFKENRGLTFMRAKLKEYKQENSFSKPDEVPQSGTREH
jgi:hypothetical protein